MLTDPQTITVNAVGQVCPRINQDNNGATYRLRDSTTELVLNIKHSNGKIVGGQTGESHLVRIDYTVFATATEPEYHMAAWTAIHNPDGLSLTTVKNYVIGLMDFIDATLVDKLLGGES